jgi:hypothetical protein
MSAPGERPFAASVCHTCRHLRLIESARGSVFLMCTALPRKYPPQPVLRCAAHAPVESEA